MNNFIVESEAKFFCLILIGMLWYFQNLSKPKECKKIKLIYVFTFIGIVLSISLDSMTNEYIYYIFPGLCYAVLGFMWFDIIYKKNIISVILSLMVGFTAVISLANNLNLVIYLSVFAITLDLILNLYNKIRVDNLTKLYNRYGMDVEIKEQLSQYSKDKNNSFYIIACDLDNFKHINDSWGHPEGDRALILISYALSKVSKANNSEVFRIGGDEFVIITDTSEEGLALKIIEQLKNELDNIDFRDDFDIRMSMGAVLYDGVTPIDELLNNADKKLYEAKRKTKL